MKIGPPDKCFQSLDAKWYREEGINVGSDDWGRQPAGLLNMSLGHAV